MSAPPHRAGQPPHVWVLQAIPGPLTEALTRRGGIPLDVRQLVLHLLGRRTAAELRDRIERRWFKHYSNLTAPELDARADKIAWELLAPGDCPAPNCEDGWLRDDSGSCPQCRKASSVVHRTGADQPDTGQASPQYAAGIVAAMRDQRRRTYGMPRGGRGRHTVKNFADYTPDPYTLREPEPDLPTEEEVDRAKRAEHGREIQRLAEERAKADKAARADQARGERRS